MVTFLTVIHITVCCLLIIIVLLQQGKGADAGIGLGGSSTQSIFGARGAATFLSKLTTGCAVTFMLTSLSLAYLSAKDSSRSLLKEAPKVEVSPTPAVSPTAVLEVAPTAVPTITPTKSEKK